MARRRWLPPRRGKTAQHLPVQAHPPLTSTGQPRRVRGFVLPRRNRVLPPVPVQQNPPYQLPVIRAARLARLLPSHRAKATATVLPLVAQAPVLAPAVPRRKILELAKPRRTSSAAAPLPAVAVTTPVAPPTVTRTRRAAVGRRRGVVGAVPVHAQNTPQSAQRRRQQLPRPRRSIVPAVPATMVVQTAQPLPPVAARRVPVKLTRRALTRPAVAVPVPVVQAAPVPVGVVRTRLAKLLQHRGRTVPPPLATVVVPLLVPKPARPKAKQLAKRRSTTSAIVPAAHAHLPAQPRRATIRPPVTRKARSSSLPVTSTVRGQFPPAPVRRPPTRLIGGRHPRFQLVPLSEYVPPVHQVVVAELVGDQVLVTATAGNAVLANTSASTAVVLAEQATSPVTVASSGSPGAVTVTSS